MRTTTLALLPALILATVAHAQDGAPANPGGAVRVLGDHRLAVGKVVVDTQKRTVRLPGKVNMNEGDIELVACTEEGKLHETLFVTDIEPKHLQAGLLLLDLEPGRNRALKYQAEDPDAQRPVADEVTVSIQWRKPAEGDRQGELVRRRVEVFLRHKEQDKPYGPVAFAFIGSKFVQGRFAAEIDGSLVVLYHDSYAILELVHPDAQSVVWSAADPKLCPPPGTPVDIVIEAPRKKEENAAQKPTEQKETEDRE
jgi:hypothetical protein